MKILLKILAIKTVLLFFLYFVVTAFAQSNGQPLFQMQDSTAMTHDIWFWIFVGWYVYSAMVAGMPEPTPTSSPWYIWAYRSGHILAANGTSFFQNKLYWPVHPVDTTQK